MARRGNPATRTGIADLIAEQAILQVQLAAAWARYRAMVADVETNATYVHEQADDEDYQPCACWCGCLRDADLVHPCCADCDTGEHQDTTETDMRMAAEGLDG